ncbi:hypothetical protein HHK36_009600 [Tetracentron sinense]|uniref:Uncharacterized protein n=1 Tax=Tetracentron sinense TaxID=13715 RepID=A0A834ZD21_TETSI|nr:hypothetical protein HHK36_009600 [Tetracentron sinense]
MDEEDEVMVTGSTKKEPSTTQATSSKMPRTEGGATLQRANHWKHRGVLRDFVCRGDQCGKVLIASGLPSDSGLLNSSTVEAPLTINIPSGQASRALSDNLLPSCTTQGMNITVPVLIQKQPLPTVTSAERLDANGPASSGFPPRRKRKLWTEEEDNQLIAAVKKCGERSWANMLKGDFKGDRTASQLSQRWANLRKRQNLGGVANSRGSQLSEAQLATRRAVSLALHMPMVACSVSTAATYTNTTSGSSALPTAQAEASQVSVTPSEMSAKSAVGSSISLAQYQSQDSQQIPTPTTASSRTGTSTTPKSQKKTSSVPVTSLSPDPMIQAAAVAAGARIATHSTAASLLKAAQSKSAFHIRPGGSLMKTSVPGGTKPWAPNHVGPHPNVHYIRTGLATPPPPPTFSGVMPSVSPRPGGIQQAHASSVRPAVPTGQVLQASAVTSANLSAQQTMSASSIYVIPSGTAEGKSNNVISTLGMVELSSREEVKPAEEMKENGSGDVPKEHVQDDQAARANSDF